MIPYTSCRCNIERSEVHCRRPYRVEPKCTASPWRELSARSCATVPRRDGIADDVIPLNSPGGSTLQWGVMRGLLCLTLFLRVILLHYLSFIFTSLVLSNYCRLQSLSCRKLCWSVLVSLQSCFVQSLKCCVGRGASKSLVKCCVVGLAMTRIFIRSVTATVRYRYLAIGCTSQETPLSQAAQ